MKHTPKHTPGPWRTWRERDGTISINEVDADGTCGPQIASVLSENTDDMTQVEADAHLIASSPKMYFALKLWMAIWEEAGDELPSLLGGGYDQLNAAVDAANEAFAEAEQEGGTEEAK